MTLLRGMRTALLALVAIVGLSLAGPAQAGGGTIEITWIKGGWFIGASAGSGVLHYGGRSYPLSIGGLSGGLIFGAAKADFHGEVYNINNPGDIAGVYGAGGAGVAAGPGGGVIALYNTNGVRLELRGRQVGLMFNADWSGLVIKLAP